MDCCSSIGKLFAGCRCWILPPAWPTHGNRFDATVAAWQVRCRKPVDCYEKRNLNSWLNYRHVHVEARTVLMSVPTITRSVKKKGAFGASCVGKAANSCLVFMDNMDITSILRVYFHGQAEIWFFSYTTGAIRCHITWKKPGKPGFIYIKMLIINSLLELPFYRLF